jgi:ferrous iron transport protein A
MEQERARAIGLDRLQEQRWAIVSDVHIPADPASHALVLRLLELGFVPGERVCMLREGSHPASPLAIRVGRTTFALRRQEATLIQVIPE